ncbi:MAG: NDMA-dependent alcohol dehydrogenase [Pseudonocardia sp.]
MPTTTRAAVLTSAPGEWSIETLEADDPRRGEIVVQMAAAGLCHSDDHVAKGDMVVDHPMCGGHEGAGVVVGVGPDTAGYALGDHVVFSFVPTCGRCRWCAQGRQNLCDLGAHALAGARYDDPGSYRMSWSGVPVGQMCGVGTFSEFTTVAVNSAVKIPEDVPLTSACLLGCAVGTGWGSAVRVARVEPGDVVVVMGIGGIGINAVQGAAMAGASHVLAVDPVELKRTTAARLGATATFTGMAEATAVARELTNGQGADAVVVTVGVTGPDHVAAAVDGVRKGGVVVVTGIGPVAPTMLPINLAEFTLTEKRLVGALYGGCRPTSDIPHLAALYRTGQLELDGLVTRRYQLSEINKAYQELLAGDLVRGIVEFG